MNNAIKFLTLNFFGVLLLTNLHAVVHKWDSTYTSIASPTSGAGVRMMWSDSISSLPYSFFRAGHVTGSSWDSSSIGSFSVAFGKDTKASGTYSFSHGFGPTASGAYSFAFGSGTNLTSNTLASGSYSFAFGRIAKAQSAYSFALGEQTTVSGSHAFVSGFNSTVGSGANYSFAHGFNNQANGNSSTAIGYENRAEGWGSVAMGVLSMAKGDHSFAHGYGAVAENNVDPTNPFNVSKNNYAFGWDTISKGASTFVVGQNNDISIFTSNP